MALARLDQDELAEAKGDEDEVKNRRQEKLESAITSYRRAIELGLRDPAEVRRLIELLFLAGRGSEALEIYSHIPAIGQQPGGLEQMMSEVALRHRDIRQAEELARKAVAASPGDFRARVWLVNLLIGEGRRDEAEVILRDAVAADKADPDRWANLVTFLAQVIRQPEKAEQVVRDAEASIAKAPLVLAQCCGIVGKAYEAGEPERAKSWYAQARHWFDEAQKALKDPGDLTVKRRLAEFLLKTNEADGAEGPLKEILARTADGKSPDLAVWARRNLAMLYAQGNPPRIAEALALLPDRSGQAGGDADDLRLLALVHADQGTPEGRRQAIGDLQALIGRESATPDDRRRLAQLLEAAGEWERAREQFRELILRTEGARDPDTLVRRPVYITLFFDALIRHHKPGDDSDLAEARQLVEKLRSPRTAMTTLVMEAQLEKTAGQPAEAAKKVRQFADQPDLTTNDRLRLAAAAEQLGLFDVALAIFRRVADEPPTDPRAMPNWARLADYLSRRGQVKDAIDLCEARWADPKQRRQVASIGVGILANPETPLDQSQTRRVIGWLDRARQQEPKEFIFPFGLGNLYERLGDYPRAKEMYRAAIKVDDRDGAASNNLAWLIALTGDKGNEAFDLIDGVIRAKGANPEYLDTRGMVRLAVGQGRLAVADLEAALKAAPSPPKYFHLAKAYLMLNDKERARRVLEVGKNRGLPSGLHRLELAAYKQMASELGMP